MELYLTDANITYDDDITEANSMVAFKFPDYHLIRVFDDKLVDLIYSIEDPSSVAEFNADKTVSYYREIIPITVASMNKIGITADKIGWKGEMELRRICESYPFGSVRIMEDSRDKTVRSGAVTIFMTEFKLSYRRRQRS